MEEFNRDFKKLGDLKQFWDIIYDGSIGANSIRIFQNNKKNNTADDKEFNRVNFFNKIDDLIKFTTINSYGLNTYFTLATTNGNSGWAEDSVCRTILAFDFDKKDLGDNFKSKDIIIRFKEIGLWYHALIDSGMLMCV